MPATLVVTPELTNVPPRVRLDVTIPGGAGVSVLIVRLDPDGRTQAVRLADPAVMTGLAWVGYDYEAPYGASVMYSATVTYTNPGTIVESASAWVTLAVVDVWLIHPGVPALSMLLAKVKSLDGRTRPVNRGVFQPFGRTNPIVVTDGRRKAVQSQLVIRTRTLSELDALIALTDDAAVLLLNVPASLGWGVSNEYVSLGDLVESREADRFAGLPSRIMSAPYLVVSQPIGGSQSQRTYADVLAEAATYQDVLNTRATYLELLAPTS
jgi:hypothetical protein